MDSSLNSESIQQINKKAIYKCRKKQQKQRNLFRTFKKKKQIPQVCIRTNFDISVCVKAKENSKINYLKMVSREFSNLFGRHSVMNYDKKFKFQERWKKQNEQAPVELERTTVFFTILAFLRLFLLNFCIWAISVKVVFFIQNTEWIYYLVMTLGVSELIKNANILKSYTVAQRIKLIWRKFIIILMGFILCFPSTEQYSIWRKILSIVLLLILNLKAKKLYEVIKIFHINANQREIFDIIDLFLLLMTVSHIFALILYQITYFHPQNNWLTSIHMNNQEWYTKYIYSFYFSNTTLLTVGYGDISPTNITEIIAILATELFGVASFAYAVNKIGVAICKISQKTQQIQKDLSRVEVIGNNYKLQPQIIGKMQNQVAKAQDLSPEMNLGQEKYY